MQETIGQPLDLLGMDACLMATLEVAYQVRNSVRYLVASEELVPGHSWPYDTIFGDLRVDPERTPAEVAVSVVQQYTELLHGFPAQGRGRHQGCPGLGHHRETGRHRSTTWQQR